MSHSISVAGKGGSGKTTIASLVIRYLMRNAPGPILAVDADANANLGESLGLELKETIGSILAKFQGEKLRIPAGITKQNYLEYRLNRALTEGDGLDLITMGRGEGQDCYCYPNLVLRQFIDRLSGNYAYVVMDNEAGLEHLSRGTTRDVDDLILVSSHTVKGVRAVARIRELISELRLNVRRQSLVVNAVPEAQLATLVEEEISRLGLEPALVVPEDKEVYHYDLGLRPLLDLPDSSLAVKAVEGLMSRLIAQKGT